jgi:hypothetical protein
MGALLFRLALLVVGMGAVEIGLGQAMVRGSLVGWALTLLVGLPLLVAGSVGFMGPLLGGPTRKGGHPDA